MVMDDIEAQKMLEDARKTRRDRSIQEDYFLPPKDNHLPRSHQNLSLDLLIPFADHPFRPYDDGRLSDMVESIKANGVIEPIIVRLHSEPEKYEILSGHNRVNAARKAGLHTIPADIFRNLTDDEARLIVAESNLIQRSFADMPHSERAEVITAFYDAMKKKPGYRSDLLEENQEKTRSPVENRTMAKLGKQYGLSKETIARYLRISKLIPGFQERLDKETLSIRAGVELSYLSIEEQTAVEELLRDDEKVSMQQARQLREASSSGGLTQETAKQILKKTPPKAKSISISRELLTKYFHEEQTAEEIEQVVAEALELYFQQR